MIGYKTPPSPQQPLTTLHQILEHIFDNYSARPKYSANPFYNIFFNPVLSNRISKLREIDFDNGTYNIHKVGLKQSHYDKYMQSGVSGSNCSTAMLISTYVFVRQYELL